MELRDLLITPILILVVYFVAYIVRPLVTDDVNRVYFFPALTVRIIGALAVGFIYQFYYNGGDTYNYHTHGSRHLWNAFIENPNELLNLFFNERLDARGFYKYGSKIPFLTDPSSYTIVRIAFIFDVFTFSTYSATAVIFAVLSFVGVWLFFKTFYEQYPHLHRGIAFSAFFIPSVFFWGSGVLKDTVTLACLGMAVYHTYRVFIVRRFTFFNIVILLVVLYGLYKIKVYIFLTYLPAAVVWIFLKNFGNIRSLMLRIAIFPFVIGLTMWLAYYTLDTASKSSDKYSLENIGTTAQVTAYDIRYYTGKDAGSGYTLGELDGTLTSMIALAPAAVNVTIFRPYLWEVKNPLMLLSAIESFGFLVVFLFLLISRARGVFKAISEPNIIFLLIFSVVFAFAVGVATFNFGTLVRYKIPMLPFLGVAITLLYSYAYNDKKVDELDVTE